MTPGRNDSTTTSYSRTSRSSASRPRSSFRFKRIERLPRLSDRYSADFADSSAPS